MFLGNILRYILKNIGVEVKLIEKSMLGFHTWMFFDVYRKHPHQRISWLNIQKHKLALPICNTHGHDLPPGKMHVIAHDGFTFLPIHHITMVQWNRNMCPKINVFHRFPSQATFSTCPWSGFRILFLHLEVWHHKISTNSPQDLVGCLQQPGHISIFRA